MATHPFLRNQGEGKDSRTAVSLSKFLSLLPYLERESGLRITFMGGAAKPCDSCKSAPAILFCRSDAVFLCLSCDSDVHKLGQRHERVWMCEVCEQSPAVLTCKADAATLCLTCDADIHSANPLARRHERVPVEPFFESAESMVKSSSAAFNFLVYNGADIGIAAGCRKEDGEAASWLLMNQGFNSKLMEGEQLKSEDTFLSEMDMFNDFEYPNPTAGTDSVVPVQTKQVLEAAATSHSNENCFNIDFCRSKLNSFTYPSQGLSHSISSSSLDVGIVPDGNSGNSLSEISFSFSGNVVEAGVSGSATAEQATPLCGLDREAKVLRYREKKKNRRFEKTIRYASRKAYAETRPRIKGRFAKRNDTQSDVDRIYSSVAASFHSEHQYGIVPSF